MSLCIWMLISVNESLCILFVDINYSYKWTHYWISKDHFKPVSQCDILLMKLRSRTNVPRIGFRNANVIHISREHTIAEMNDCQREDISICFVVIHSAKIIYTHLDWFQSFTTAIDAIHFDLTILNLNECSE